MKYWSFPVVSKGTEQICHKSEQMTADDPPSYGRESGYGLSELVPPE